MSTRNLPLGLLGLLVCLPGCGHGEHGGPDAAETSTSAAETVVVEQGAPIDAPVEPAPVADEGPGAQKLDRRTAVQIVAAGIENLDTSNVSVIDDVPTLELDEGTEAISWRALSLREIYGEHLRALLYPEKAPAGEYDFPENIKQMDGKDVAILGYMIPLEWDDNKVPEFMLVRDLMGCCFGSGAQPDEWIDVRMVKGEAEYISYMPVVVIGKLSVGSFVDDAGYQAGCYHIDATSVQMEL